jgi:hypothetical protein
MNKADLIADLQTQYKFVGAPEAQQTNSIVTPYVVSVLETGLSEANKKPTAYQKNILFYVYNEGDPSEEAYYSRVEPTNTSNTDVSASSDTLKSYSSIFTSDELKTRILGSIIKAAVYFVGVGVVNKDFHWAQDAIKDPTKYLSAFLCECAANGNVRTSGAAISDADLDYSRDERFCNRSGVRIYKLGR